MGFSYTYLSFLFCLEMSYLWIKSECDKIFPKTSYFFLLWWKRMKIIKNEIRKYLNKHGLQPLRIRFIRRKTFFAYLHKNLSVDFFFFFFAYPSTTWQDIFIIQERGGRVEMYDHGIYLQTCTLDCFLLLSFFILMIIFVCFSLVNLFTLSY